ncbi:hypothetical protein EJB05_30426, partial [Eragrostis curvula]
MELKLTTSLPIIIIMLIMHHLSLTDAFFPDHIMPNTSLTGFSLRLVANHTGPDQTIHRGSDGFLHLLHSLRVDQLPQPTLGASSSVLNFSTLHTKLNTRKIRISSAQPQPLYIFQLCGAAIVDDTITMELKLTTSLPIIIIMLIMHHLSLIDAFFPDHIMPNTSLTGFSLRLVANHTGPDQTIHRGSDGFLHLLHSLRVDQLPQPTLGASSSVLNFSTLHTKLNTRVQFAHSVAVFLGTGNAKQEYYLKLQCEPCEPKARQYSPVFVPLASPTFRPVAAQDQICQRPYEPAGNWCAFHIAGPRQLAVHGYIGFDHLSMENKGYQGFLFGCSLVTNNFQSEDMYAGIAGIGLVPTSLVMQAAAHGLTQFSYCLFVGSETKRKGFLRFGTDVPHNLSYRTTKLMPTLDAHESEYYVNLVGISLGTQKLDQILPEMFARDKDGRGGCVIDIGTPLTMMVQEAYHIIEEALWSVRPSAQSECSSKDLVSASEQPRQ